MVMLKWLIKGYLALAIATIAVTFIVIALTTGFPVPPDDVYEAHLQNDTGRTIVVASCVANTCAEVDGSQTVPPGDFAVQNAASGVPQSVRIASVYGNVEGCITFTVEHSNTTIEISRKTPCQLSTSSRKGG